MSKPNDIDLSVIIPVYYSAAIFPELFRRLVIALEPSVSSFEILAVVDGCRDSSFDVIAEHAKKDPRVKALYFSRNFGHQAAVAAGLQYSRGKIIAVMDDDLEDPPELLPLMLDKMKEGFDVVYGIRKGRKRGPVRRILYKLFYRIFNYMVDIDVPNDAGDFGLMSRRMVDVLNAMPERSRYLRGLRAWSGFEQTGIEYDRQARYANQPGYTLKKYFALAKDAAFSFSYKPLELISQVGFVIAAISFFYGLCVVYKKLTGQVANVRGWASTLTAILFFSGIQMLSLGIIGEYISRIYDEVKRRPKFIVRDSVGFQDGGPFNARE